MRFHRRNAWIVLGSLFLVPVSLRAQGWADLHAHPASHLAFGHDPLSFCDRGIFHGRPGENPMDRLTSWESDLEPCEPERHTPCEIFDIVQKRQRTAIVNTLENRFGVHLSNGAPDLGSWPNAGSRTHQQMHLEWLHRAYRGGMRLMIASVTDNELLERWWSDDGGCHDLFRPEAGHDFESAVEQIKFLESLDRATEGHPDDWLDIVRHPDEIEAAWREDKLALILGVEMDQLTLEEIHRLIDEYGVRSVIPIHLADNSLGGSAVYDELFNVLTQWHNGRHFEVEGDPTVSARLPRPQYIDQSSIPLVGCSQQPTDVSREVWADLGYEAIDYRLGHRNRLGLTDPGAIKSLMEKGVLIDVAHMSWRATDQTLQLAEAFDYPVIDSHTGLRSGCDGDLGSERSLTAEHAARIAALDGVIGLGTEGDPGRETLFFHHGSVRLTGAARVWQTVRGGEFAPRSGHALERLYVRIATGGDNLNGCSRARLLLNTTRGTRRFPLSGGSGFAEGSVNDAEVNLLDAFGSPLGAGEVTSVGFQLVQGCALGDDNWDLKGFQIVYQGRDSRGNPVRGLLLERSGAPYRRLTGSVPVYRSANLNAAMRRQESLRGSAVARLELSIGIGPDGIDMGDDLDDGLEWILVFHDGTRLKKTLRELPGFPSNFGGNNVSALGTWTLPPGISYGEIAAMYLHNIPGSGPVFSDNVDVLRARLRYFDDRGTVRVLANYQASEFRGSPNTWRLTRDEPDALLWKGLGPRVDPALEFDKIELKALTGQDDLRFGENARLVLTLSTGEALEFDLNRGSLWDVDAEKAVILRLDRSLRAADFAAAGVVTGFGGGVSGDNWNLDSFIVSGLRDPARRWLEDFRELYAAMSRGGQPAIALGTDLNGFQPQMPYVDEGKGSGSKKLDLLPPRFAIERGDASFGRYFSLEKDGIAHVGMLPDFINHIQGFGDPRTALLFSSAAATHEAWRGAVLRRGTIAASPTPVLREPVSVCAPTP